MRARSRTLHRLSNGIESRTPLLVPALSSRAMGPLEVRRKPRGKLEEVACSIVHSRMVEAVEHSLLISAYDIHYGLLEEHKKFTRGFRSSTLFQKIPVLIIDSGGYEVAGGPSGGVFWEGQKEPLDWQLAHYERLTDKLDPDVQAILVSWDYYGSYAEQIALAQNFFGQRPRFASTILLKPPGNMKRAYRNPIHTLDEMSPSDIANLRAFDIVGVAEKELGDTVLSRMVQIAELRRRLDEENVAAPVHVFGALDPLYTPLYFAAGGEIFDGLSWLRYGFRDGILINRDAAAILDQQVSSRSQVALQNLSFQNLRAISNLTEDLDVFAQKGEWSRFGPRAEVLVRIYESFEAQLSRKR